jgi:hypothetical protein
VADEALPALERGDVLFLPQLPFPIDPADAEIFSPAILSSSKNASLDPATGKVGGTSLTGAPLDRLRRVMSRFSAAAAALVHEACPVYRGELRRARASFRPAEIAGRATSWRKDDTRLHIDSFPASMFRDSAPACSRTSIRPAGRDRGVLSRLRRRRRTLRRSCCPGAGSVVLRLLRGRKAGDPPTTR